MFGDPVTNEKGWDVKKLGDECKEIKYDSKELASIIIPLPPLPLQQSFASKIEAIERQKALVQQSINEAETLFNSRMDYYFD